MILTTLLNVAETPEVKKQLVCQTAKGLEAYGQFIDHNDKPTNYRAKELIAELVDGAQYLLWLHQADENPRWSVEAQRLIQLADTIACEILGQRNGAQQ